MAEISVSGVAMLARVGMGGCFLDVAQRHPGIHPQRKDAETRSSFETTAGQQAVKFPDANPRGQNMADLRRPGPLPDHQDLAQSNHKQSKSRLFVFTMFAARRLPSEAFLVSWRSISPGIADRAHRPEAVRCGWGLWLPAGHVR